LFAPTVLDTIDKIYDSATFAQETAILQFMDFIRLNFGLMLLVAGILTMIIIYAKVRYFPAR